MLEVAAGYLLGLLHGMRHALEPDHVAAVSTVIAEQRTARASVRFAVAWGAGHAVMLLVVGGLLFAFRRQMPPRLGDLFELGVAFMLVGLGVRGLLLAARGVKNEAIADPLHGHVASWSRWSRARRPLVIGLVHGLAGSGALAALVMSELPSAFAGIVFMAIYGFGAMCGMAALAGLVGMPLAHLARRPRVIPTMMAATGLFSILLGALWAWPIAQRMLVA